MTTHINYIADFEFYRRLLAAGLEGKSTSKLLQTWNKALFPNQASTMQSVRTADDDEDAEECDTLLAAMKESADSDSDEGNVLESI